MGWFNRNNGRRVTIVRSSSATNHAANRIRVYHGGYNRQTGRALIQREETLVVVAISPTNEVKPSRGVVGACI